MRLDAEYPVVVRFEVEDLVVDGSRGVARSRSRNDDVTYYVASFVEVEDGLVRDLVEVWTDDVAPPPTHRPHPERTQSLRVPDTRTPRVPGRAHLPLLHSCPGGVRRGTTTRGAGHDPRTTAGCRGNPPRGRHGQWTHPTRRTR